MFSSWLPPVDGPISTFHLDGAPFYCEQAGELSNPFDLNKFLKWDYNMSIIIIIVVSNFDISIIIVIIGILIIGVLIIGVLIVKTLIIGVLIAKNLIVRDAPPWMTTNKNVKEN